MTIRLITGIPGSGKTLYAVSELKKELEKNTSADEPRAIYCDITGLKVNDIQPPPIDWRETPPRSLLIYDEAQLKDEFKAGRGNSPHEFISELTIHRKTGHEIWFITQAPKRLHNDILDMVEIHHHLERPYGAKLASIYEYRGHEKNPSSITAKGRAQNKTLFNYDKSLYELYESSQVKDGIKFRLPRELTIWVILALIVGYYGYTQLTSDGTQKYVNMAKGQPAETETDKPKQDEKGTAETVKEAVNTAKDEQTEKGDKTQDGQELTKEQLQLKLKAQEVEFLRQLQAQELQSKMQFEQLQKQYIEQQKQLDDFMARLELIRTLLPKNYEIIKNEPSLQVRAVIKMGDKCNAYNAHGDLMTLSPKECAYYLEGVGRVQKGNNNISSSTPSQTTDVKATPVKEILEQNPDFAKQPPQPQPQAQGQGGQPQGAGHEPTTNSP